jgi:Abortive infection alpha
MGDNSLIPISDEQARLGQEALKTLQGVGGFMKDALGTVPQDVVGLLGGDYLKVRRAENLSRMIQKAKKRLEDNHVTEPDAPPSLAIPIMIAAADESRDELQDLWAELLAAAADPKRSRTFRLKFIEIAKRLDPLDPLVLNQLAVAQNVDPNQPKPISDALGLSNDEVAVSLANLEAVGLAARTDLGNASVAFVTMRPTPLGRELLRAVEPKPRTQG